MKPQGNIRSFPLRVVLTVTTGKLLTKGKNPDDNGIGDMYDLLGHMTGEPPHGHQLGRFADECNPWLLRWYPELDHPQLTVIALGSLLLMLETDRQTEPAELLIAGWIECLVASGLCKEDYAIGQIPMDDHDSIPSYDELVAIRGSDEGVIVLDEEGIHDSR